MERKSERAREITLFVLRTLVLFFLLLNAVFQIRDQLDIWFQSAAFVIAVLAALWMEKSRLRFIPSMLLAAALPALLRMALFLVFRLQRVAASAPPTDFLFFYFDKDFFPGLVAYGIAWLFTFLALRHRAFVPIECGLNALLLIAVFWSQARYHVTLYPHPSIFAWMLALFIVVEFFVLALSRQGPDGAGTPPVNARAILGFAWVLVPLLLVFLLFLLGKYGEGAVMAGGGLMKPTLFRFDFAPYVKLESEIRTSDEAVMLFRTEGVADRFLLRRYVLSDYDPRQGFSISKSGGIDEYPSVVPDSVESFADPGYTGRQAVSQEYFFLTLDPSSLISLNYPLRVTPLKNWKSSSFLRVYRVESRVMRSIDAPRRVISAPQLAPAALARYTAGSTDERIHALALEVTKDATGYYEKVASIESYLKSNYLYSLKPGIAEDGDQLHHFLFVSKKGYCSYFAFAMTLMCRSLGIPSRVAVGFYVDPQSEILNFYEVRAFQAHAWVEVYFGSLGWVEFDPTSDTPAPGEDFQPFPGPEAERMAKLIAEIVNNQTDEPEQAQPTPTAVGTVSRVATQIARIAVFLARLWYLTLPTLYALFLLCAKLLPSLPRLFSRDPRRRTKARYRLAVVRLAGVRVGRRATESPCEHAMRIECDEDVGLAPLVDCYLKAAFDAHFDDEDEVATIAAFRGFLASYRARFIWPARALGALNPLALSP